MPMVSPEDRAEALLNSPAGCVLLLIAEAHGLTPADLSRPEVALFAIARAVGQISPWLTEHDRVVQAALGQRDRLQRAALDLVRHPGIAWWWAPIDRRNQLWLPQHDGFICPEEVWELRPRDKPNPFERYVHEPRPLVSTSNRHGDLSAELAHVLAGSGDWELPFPIHPRHATIRENARVLEINSAQDWHDFVCRYPADGFHATHPDIHNQPWGNAPGLMVPNWREASFDWDGVHVTLWAFLTANQVRVASAIGWTEPWSWEGAHTIWLDWIFASVEDLPPVAPNTFDSPNYSPAWNTCTEPV
jgi:hypothetical protein